MSRRLSDAAKAAMVTMVTKIGGAWTEDERVQLWDVCDADLMSHPDHADRAIFECYVPRRMVELACPNATFEHLVIGRDDPHLPFRPCFQPSPAEKVIH